MPIRILTYMVIAAVIGFGIGWAARPKLDKSIAVLSEPRAGSAIYFMDANGKMYKKSGTGDLSIGGSDDPPKK